MYNDIIELLDFYQTPIGHAVQRITRRYIRTAWPNVQGMHVAGVGYATPFLGPFLDEAKQVVAVMPAQQGVTRWPIKQGTNKGNLVVLAGEGELPLSDVSIDRILLIHSVECSEQLQRLLREIWRVMTPEGRALVVVPNRRGIWARLDSSPFGHGQPYTPTQVSRLLDENLLVPENSFAGLFVPPTNSRMIIASAPAIEKVGTQWFRKIGGLLFVEVRKLIYASSIGRKKEKIKPLYTEIASGTKREDTFHTDSHYL
tara:strand:- start:424 stop:1194 length:771 start_codon:yes stop_codon:yes gene_type:complete